MVLLGRAVLSHGPTCARFRPRTGLEGQKQEDKLHSSLFSNCQQEAKQLAGSGSSAHLQSVVGNAQSLPVVGASSHSARARARTRACAAGSHPAHAPPARVPLLTG